VRLVTAVLLALLLAPAAALAGPSSPRSSIVALGDSYISGEAGRWAGNSPNSAGDRDGTDRAAVCSAPGVCSYDQARPYGASAAECHRSDTALVRSNRIAVDEKVNLSCSGGVARNLFRATQGGRTKGGEAKTQADQLADVARNTAVKLVIVSVGGNDLGFASIVQACFTAYVARSGPCEPSQQPRIDAMAAKAQADVEKAIDEVRAVMADAGYAAAQYRLVLQTYPIVVPRAAEARYPELSPERTTFGCPFYDSDLDWARDEAGPQIGSIVKAAARARGTEVLELRDAFQGREVCAKGVRAAAPGQPVTAQTGEWGRALSASSIQQGETQELFHPNAFGQQALGACLEGVFGQPRPGEFACTNAAGRMQVARTGDVRAAEAGAPCAGSPPDDARAVPRGRGLRFELPAGRAFDVDVFQQSAGRLVLGERRVARFRGRRGTFTWTGRGGGDGVYAVRFRAGRDSGRLALVRSGGRFRVRPDYAESPGCGLVRRFKLERPVFGGLRNRALGIAVRLERDGPVRVRVLRGGRVLRTLRGTARAGRILRFRVASERLPRGELVVELRAGDVVRRLGARRL
jgi:lysophospholipase L1-like esterase